jgi:ABC-type multidrug transport system fused ATPase/permease subunit
VPDIEEGTEIIVPGDREVVVVGAPRWTRSRVQLLGAGLVAYGLIGIAIFIVVAVSISRPLERIGELSRTVQEQKTLLIESMDEAETTIRDMAQSARRAQTSLNDARAATDRSATIAQGVAASMFGLRDAMSISVFGAQPLIGLGSGFEQAGSQLQQLSTDLSTIGTSLATNGADVITVATDLEDLADTVATLTESVQTAPDVGVSVEALDAFRLAIFAVAGWLLLFAVGCTVVGAYLVIAARRRAA